MEEKDMKERNAAIPIIWRIFLGFCLCLGMMSVPSALVKAAQTIPYTAKAVWLDTDGKTPITPDEETTVTLYIKRNEVETGEYILLDYDNDWEDTLNAVYEAGASYGPSRVEVEGYKYSTDTEIINGNSFLTTITLTKKAAAEPERDAPAAPGPGRA